MAIIELCNFVNCLVVLDSFGLLGCTVAMQICDL